MPDTKAITADSLGKTYYLGIRRRPVAALRNVSFQVRQGEVFAFLGLNGAGKTTTIKMLLDHARPSTGRCSLFGIDSKSPKSRAKVGYMPDLPNFYRFLTAAELLDYFGKLHGLDRPSRLNRSKQLIEVVGLHDRENEPLRGFSRGMLQRVGLAQALIANPELLILDEPLGGLDPVGRYEFHNIIRSLKSEGKTIFFSSHILEDAEKIADSVGIIHKGSLVASGPMSELINQPNAYEIELQRRIDDSSLRSHAKNNNWNLVENNGILVLSVPDETSVQAAVRMLSEGGYIILSIIPQRRTLEQAFITELEKWER